MPGYPWVPEKLEKNKFVFNFRSLSWHAELRNNFAIDIRSRPGKPNQRKGQNEKFMNFAHSCEFWWFPLEKQVRFTSNFCSGWPRGKVHEVAFLWFGLPGRLLMKFISQRRALLIEGRQEGFKRRRLLLIWTPPSLVVRVLSIRSSDCFRDLLDLSLGKFQKGSGMQSGTVPKNIGTPRRSEKKEAHKHKSLCPLTVRLGGGSPGRVSRGQRFMCYLRNPRNINLFVRVPDREDR